MKDIPVFTSEFGAAALILRDIPYKKEAYIRIHATQQPRQLLDECVSFCRMCGAEKISATGHPHLEEYPLLTTIVGMTVSRQALPRTDAALFPLLPETLEKWRTIYNDRMADVPNVSYLSEKDARKLLDERDAYFIHRNGELLGIGRASADTIHVVISVKPGAGRDVVLALATLLEEDTIQITVANNNFRAIKLYETLGFLATKELSRWYQIL